MLEYIKQNKHVIIVAITIFVLSTSSVLFFFGSNQDLKTDLLEGTKITEGINLKSLQEKEQKYRKLLNNQEDTIFAVNVDGAITFASWDVENNLGYKQSELTEKNLYSLIDSEDLSGFMVGFGQAIKNKKPVVNVGPYRLLDASGNYHKNIGYLFPNAEEILIASKDISPAQKEPQQNHPGKKIQNEKNTPTHFLANRFEIIPVNYSADLFRWGSW